MIRLEPLTVRHAALLGPILADAEALRFTRIPEPPGPGFAEEWMARYERGRADGSAEGFAILDAADGTFLGVALAPVIDREAREVELGYIVAPDARGRGAGTAALQALTDWAFAELGALRIQLIIDAENAPVQAGGGALRLRPRGHAALLAPQAGHPHRRGALVAAAGRPLARRAHELGHALADDRGRHRRRGAGQRGEDRRVRDPDRGEAVEPGLLRRRPRPPPDPGPSGSSLPGASSGRGDAGCGPRARPDRRAGGTDRGEPSSAASGGWARIGEQRTEAVRDRPTSDGSPRYRCSIRARPSAPPGSTAPRERGVRSATGNTHFHPWGAAASGSIQG